MASYYQAPPKTTPNIINIQPHCTPNLMLDKAIDYWLYILESLDVSSPILNNKHGQCSTDEELVTIYVIKQFKDEIAHLFIEIPNEALQNPNQFEIYLQDIASDDGIFKLCFCIKLEPPGPQHIGLHAKNVQIKTILKALINNIKIMPLTSNWESTHEIVIFRFKHGD